MTTDPYAKWQETYKTRPISAVIDFAKKAADYLHEQPSASILDIGCGDGRDANFLTEQGFAVTAIDFSDVAIERVKALNPAINAHVMDTTKMDFPDASFDAIYAHLSLHYFDDTTTTAIFENIRRMLKPGGLFFVKCKSTKDPYYGVGEEVGPNMFLHGHLRHLFTPDYMRTQLADFTILTLDETSADYDGKTSAFVEAVAKK